MLLRGVLSLLVLVPLLQAQVVDKARSARGRDKTTAPRMDPSQTDAQKVGHGRLELRVGYYNNTDGLSDGNPFLDEELTVVEPVIYLDYQMSKKTRWWTKLSFDIVSSASIDRLSKFPEQSGASGDYYIGLDTGIKRSIDDHHRYGLWVHGSAEYDYKSFGIGGDYAWDAADRNSTMRLHGNLFVDSLDLIRFNGMEDGSDTRSSLSLGLTRYQVFNPELHGEFGATLTYQDGYLGTPYNAVVLEDPADPPNPNLYNQARGTEIAERLPDTRTRIALHGRLRRSFTDHTAGEIGGRLYTDTWGITSVALEPRLYQWWVPDKLRARMRYRYYTQTAADDYREHFFPADATRQYLTQDSDLGKFNSHTLGLGLTWFTSPNTHWSFGADYVSRDDGIDQYYASIGYTWDF